MGRLKKYGVRKEKQLKRAFITSLEKTDGQIYRSLDILDIEPHIFYSWRNDDPDFDLDIKNMVTIVKETRLDTAEKQLDKNIREGNQRAIEYFLTRQGRDRGYGERSTLEIDKKQPDYIFFQFGETEKGDYLVTLGDNAEEVNKDFKHKIGEDGKFEEQWRTHKTLGN